MPQSLAEVTVHLVFSTKDRAPLLRDPDLRTELCAYMSAILRDKADSPALLINGVEDHVHALVVLSRKVSIMNVVMEAKKETSKWLKRRSPELQTFAWQSGYGASSVSESNLPQARRYIENQEQHHRKMSFQDEFRKLCKRHHLEIDERYVWD